MDQVIDLTSSSSSGHEATFELSFGDSIFGATSPAVELSASVTLGVVRPAQPQMRRQTRIVHHFSDEGSFSLTGEVRGAFSGMIDMGICGPFRGDSGAGRWCTYLDFFDGRPNKLDDFCVRYRILAFIPVVMTSDVEYSGEFITVSLMAITKGGLRLPLPLLLRTFLNDYGLSPVQLLVNSFRIINCVIELWPRNLGMKDSIFMDHCDIMDCFEEELAAALGGDVQHSFSSENNSSCATVMIPNSSSTTNLLCASLTSQGLGSPNSKHHKPNSWSTDNNHSNSMAPNLDQPSIFSSGFILSFDNSSSTENPTVPPRTLNSENEEVVAGILLSHQGSFVLNNEEGNKSGQGGKRSGSSNPRPASQTYDHIIAERKRREQLSQLFVALSTIVPGLKKMDKTSVLGEAVKYLKQLQNRVKSLEEQATKQTIESVVLVKKSQLLLEYEDTCSSNDNFICASNDTLPEIEAKVCNRNILLRIHCEKDKGILVKILAEMEKLNLSIVNTNVARFGNLALDITIIAEMEAESCITVKDLVRSLRQALQHFI